jgi:RHS repeat-associated protein
LAESGWALADNQETVRDWIDSSGTVVEHIAYNAFGQVTGQTINPDASFVPTNVIFGYTGKFYDTATGLQWNVNRWYDPTTGTWMTKDPKGFAAQDFNLYRYVNNEPDDATDPSGEEKAPGGAQPEREKPRGPNNKGLFSILLRKIKECQVKLEVHLENIGQNIEDKFQLILEGETNWAPKSAKQRDEERKEKESK